MNAPKGMDVDHINHNRLDNRKCNLRVCTHQQNMQNRAKGGGMSKYKGVVFDKRPLNKPWISQITTNHKHHKLGYFKTELEAAKQYNCAARILFGQFALENKI